MLSDGVLPAGGAVRRVAAGGSPAAAGGAEKGERPLPVLSKAVYVYIGLCGVCICILGKVRC